MPERYMLKSALMPQCGVCSLGANTVGCGLTSHLITLTVHPPAYVVYDYLLIFYLQVISKYLNLICK
jgi:hypothetical protein